ncbi:MAG TPA: hypothetical protein VMV69_10840 [Pirellulales bacterium]|nr:hypothetical protein [Pirellulales bacterium]
MFGQSKLTGAWRFWLALAICLASGCGPKLPANEKTYPVHGKVGMAGGAALPKGVVVYFHPPVGATCAGAVGPDGTYRASLYRGQEGLPVGEYKVRIAAGEPEGQATVYSGDLARIKEKYRKSETSGLTLTVKPEDNTFDINLE